MGMYTRFCSSAFTSALSSRMRHTRIIAIGVLCFGVLNACAKNNTGDTTGPSSTPSLVRVQNGSTQSGTVGSTLSVPLTVIVTDANGKTISGARVDWDASAGSGTLNPTASVTTNSGVAQTIWTLGTVANRPATVTAQVSGVTPVTFTATVLAGPATSVIATPELAFLGVGDTLRIRAAARDQYGNDIASQSIDFTSLDATIASVSTLGTVTARSVGATRIIAASGGKADTVPITVLFAGASSCGTATPRILALGEVFTPAAGATSASACLGAPAGVNAEFGLALISTSPSFSAVTPLEVYALGNTGPTTAAIGSSMLDGIANPPNLLMSAPSAASPSVLAEVDRHAMEHRELAPLVGLAREWQASGSLRPSAAQLVDVRVGDILKLNGNPNSGCSNPNTRTGRVAAVGTNSIIVSDTANPSGGYTDAEYATVAATWDTLVFPMDTTAFGAPTNISGYGKIILFYSRVVNALTPASAGYVIGGFFFQRDLYPKAARSGLQACPASNEAEMFYLLAPDPNGTVNGNKRTKDDVTRLNLSTTAHEFQHLINSSRRLYVNAGAAATEETWLDEGLAHTAEELLYFRISAFSSRQNLTLQDVSSTPALAATFSSYASQNFARFYTFLTNPEINSPYAPNDSLATRGATWNFLRFAAGRQGASKEAPFYRALVNSTTTGVANLSNVLPGGQFGDYLRDWAVSVMADDYSVAETAALETRYVLPAWNFRSIYPGLRFSGGTALGVYPIATRSLQNNVTQRITLAGGTSSYVRFGIASGKSALLTLSSNGSALPSVVRYSVVRLR